MARIDACDLTIMTATSISSYQPISITKIDRITVRALVEQDVAYLARASSAGKNIEQLGSERRDQIDKFVQTLPPLEAIGFLNLYQEEITSVRKLTAAQECAPGLQASLDFKIRHVVVGFAILSAELMLIIYLTFKYFN